MAKKRLVMDIECYQNYLLVAFKNVETGATRTFEMYEGQNFDRETIRAILRSCTIITFNGNHYDMIILSLVLAGGGNLKAKQASDAIIIQNKNPWDIERTFGFNIVKNIDHIDLFEVVPGKSSLKAYGGRMHVQRLQDLPIEPNTEISSEQRELLKEYCVNDLNITEALYLKLVPQIELREKMGSEYGEDLRSKSDAQVAETVIKKSITKITGEVPRRPDSLYGQSFKYIAPDFIGFITPQLNDMFEIIKATSFYVNETGSVIMPKEIGGELIKIGKSNYQMGIGGLHSTESSVSHEVKDGNFILDKDVTSYYPSIILRCRLYPKHLGASFLKVYKEIVDKRIEAKKKGDKVVSESLKITINGSFGKFGNRWSTLYSPDLLVQTTVTGQLCLLMLIEMLDVFGIDVVSANTDGVVIVGKRSALPLVKNLTEIWEKRTGFNTEDVFYKAIYSRDVNNYIALKEDGGDKLKGAFAPAGFQKNPTNEICTEAVIRYLAKKTPLHKTIQECTDIRKFITTRAVKGGAVFDEQYLGKNVRWYYGTNSKGFISYKLNGNKVAKSEGAQPIMMLPEVFPTDVNYEWYISEAQSILKDLGLTT